jgi:hypothetical protein
MSYVNKTNKEIEIEIKKMEIDYENIKTKTISLLEQLNEIEKNHSIAINELKKRGVK